MIRPTYAAMARHTSFEHERLKLSDRSIRLFQVQRGAEHEPVSLRMTQFSAQRRPSYKAISYTWGSSEDPKIILVNGKAFSLHANLWTLLYHLRLANETSFLWADALCINQFNLAERNFHVQLMGRIYDHAESVIVWLGLPTRERIDINAMQFVKEIADFRKTHPSETMFANMFFRPELEARWQILEKMCCPENPSAYWNRTWIIQEFLFANTVEVLCGKLRLDWKDFEDLLDLLLGHPEYMDNKHISAILRSRTARLTMRRRRKNSPMTLFELLMEYSDSACTERRDKVYGILGLADDCTEDKDGNTSTIRPDYDSHIVNVYMEALRCINLTVSVHKLPLAALLLLKALRITHKDLSVYITKSMESPMTGDCVPNSFVLRPSYISPIIKTFTWSSVRDLQQRLESEEWGEYIGWEVRRVVSHNRSNRRPTHLRRESSKTLHSDLPSDFISTMLEAANICTDLSTLHNYPSLGDLQIPAEHLSLDRHDIAAYDNELHQKPLAILEQLEEDGPLRLGYACTNAQKGDILVQFQELDTTLVLREIWHEFHLVGKAMMVKNSGIEYDLPLNGICDGNLWSSHCWRDRNPENVQLQTNAATLAELLSKH